jgi:signal transduction histidine kinase
MELRQRVMSVFRLGRPILRVQLTLLYSGLFLGVLAAVLLATNILFVRDSSRAPIGANAIAGVQQTAANHQFDFGPAAIGLIAAAVALAGAWWLAGRFLRPIRAITTTAQEISATNLHRRLDLNGPDDELTELGRTLDDLFGRLETSFESQRHFVANASHELRTPLAGQRTLLQVALANPDASTEDLRAACDEALQLGEQQERLIDALLTLATSERGVERWEPFDLGEIAENVLAGHRQEAERRGIRIDASAAAASALGEPRLVESLVANLVDNALQHNMTGGRVEISTISAPGRATLSVNNTGPVVPPEEVERLFQPLQQIGGERVRHTDGHGLGLAIVRAIAQAHGAKVTALSRPEGGLDIEVTFDSSIR